MKNFYRETDKYTLRFQKSYSRCRLGKRCVKKTTDNVVFRKYTIVFAINSNRVVEL